MKMSKQSVLSEKLIFTSSNFDPILALKSKQLAERCSGAKVFDNLRQYVIGLRQSASFKSIGWFPKEFEGSDLQPRKSSKRKASDLYDKRGTASSDVSSSDFDDEKRRKPKHVKLAKEPKQQQKSESGSDVSFQSLFTASSDDAGAISDQGIRSQNKRSYDSRRKALENKGDDNKKNMPQKKEASGVRESDNEKRASLQSRLKNIAKNPAQSLKSSRTDQRLAKIKNVMIENLETERKAFIAKDRSNVLQKMEAFQDGPLSVLYNCMSKGIKLKVWTRRYKGLRGVCTGYLIAFDKHMNLAMIDVDEVYTLEIRTLSQEEQIEIKRQKKADKKNRYRLNRINKNCGFIDEKENKELMERKIKPYQIAASFEIDKYKTKDKVSGVEEKTGVNSKAGNEISSQKTLSSSGSQVQRETPQVGLSLHYSSSGALSLLDAGALPSSADVVLENADTITNKTCCSSIAASEKSPMVNDALVVNSPLATLAYQKPYKKPHSATNITSFPVDSGSQQSSSLEDVSSSLSAITSQDILSSADAPPKELSSSSSSRLSLQNVASETTKVLGEIVTSQSSSSAANVLSLKSSCSKDMKSSPPDSMSEQSRSLPDVSETTKGLGEIATSKNLPSAADVLSVNSICSKDMKSSSLDSMSEQSGSLLDAVSRATSAAVPVDVPSVPNVVSAEFKPGKSQTEVGQKELSSQIEKEISACDLSFDISESSEDELTNDSVTGRINDSDDDEVRIKDFLSGIHTLGNISATSDLHKGPITSVITSLPDSDQVEEKSRDEEKKTKQELTHRVKCHFSLFSRLSRPPQLNSNVENLSGGSNLMKEEEKPEDIPMKIKQKIEGRVDEQVLLLESTGTEKGKTSQRCLDMNQGNLLLSESGNEAAKSQSEEGKWDQYIDSKTTGQINGDFEQFSSEDGIRKDSNSQYKLQKHSFVSTQEDKQPVERDFTIKSQEEFYKKSKEECRADLLESFERPDASSEISRIRNSNEDDYFLMKLELKPPISYSQMERPFHSIEGTVINSLDVSRDPRLKKMKDGEMNQRNMEREGEDVQKSNVARQVDPRVQGIGRKGLNAREDVDVREGFRAIEQVCEPVDPKGRIVAKEKAVTMENSDEREERRAREVSKEQVDARRQNAYREMADAKEQFAISSEGRDVSRERAQKRENFDESELLSIREKYGEQFDARRQSFERVIVDTTEQLTAKDDAVGCNVARERVTEKLGKRELMSASGQFQEQVDAKRQNVEREIADTKEHLAAKDDALGCNVTCERVQATEKLGKRELLPVSGQFQERVDPRRQHAAREKFDRIERLTSVEKPDGKIGSIEKSDVMKNIDTRIAVASRDHVPVIEHAAVSIEQSRYRTHSDQSQKSDSICTKQKPRQMDPRLKSRRSIDQRSNSDVDQSLVIPKQTTDDASNKPGFSDPSVVSEQMSKLLSLLGTNLNTASVGGNISSNIQLIEEQKSERPDNGGFSQRGMVEASQRQGQYDTDASKAEKTELIHTETQSNDTRNALGLSVGDGPDKSDTTTLVSISKKQVVSRNVDERDDDSTGAGLVYCSDTMSVTKELASSKDTSKDEKQMSKLETGLIDLNDTVKCTKEQRSSKDISNDERQGPKPEENQSNKITKEEGGGGGSALARFFQKRRPSKVADQKQTLIKLDLSKTKSNLQKQSASEVIFSRGKLDYPKRTLPTVSAVFDPKKSLPGHVFKERHVNQLFIRGDNIAMVAYDKKS